MRYSKYAQRQLDIQSGLELDRRQRKHQITTQRDLVKAFWEAHPNADRRRGPYWETPADRDYCTDTRCAFVDYVDALERDGTISTALAWRATL